KHIGGGLEHLTQNAIKGMGQMPPRGGNPDLNDIEIARAIVFMANQSGANFKEPAAKSAPAAANAKAKAK
ncbi:MAG TPA: cytochrome c5 family protein, partial [Burkholderiales bacterium]|nr:cytochrome c5 family protein [Burkholderiales bacterium]